jgi:threonine/homoserine/homoserine lactone efflux protein
MEFIACILGGIGLVASGLWLTRFHPPKWDQEGDTSSDEARAFLRWGSFQRVLRILTNSLLVLIGISIFSAAFVPHGRTWMLLWSVILVLLLVCILFAMIDAFSSLAGYRRALPEAVRRSFGNEHEG